MGEINKLGIISLILIIILLIAAGFLVYSKGYLDKYLLSKKELILKENFGKYSLLEDKNTLYGERIELEASHQLKFCVKDNFSGIEINTQKQIVYIDKDGNLGFIQKEDAEKIALAAFNGEVTKTEFAEKYIIRHPPQVLSDCDLGPVWKVMVKLENPFVQENKKITYQEVAVNNFGNIIYKRDFYTRIETIKVFLDPKKEISQEIFIPTTGEFLNLVK